MTAPHEAKLAALMALEADLLSAVGRRRIEAHLEGCATCREARAMLGDYEMLRGEARGLSVPEVDFGSMELPLAREARRVADASAPSTGPMVAAVALAAAVLLGVWLRGGPAAGPEAPLADNRGALPTAEQPPEGAALDTAVTAIGGASLVGATAATLEGAVAQGTAVETPADGTLHLRLSEGTGVVLGADSRVVFEGARKGAIALRLERGSVDCKVAPLKPGERFVVRTGETTVSVRGTHFRVVAGEQPEVELTEGRVDVTVRGEVVAKLAAPAHWPPSKADERAPDADASADAQPIMPAGIAGDTQGWATLTLPVMQRVKRWHVLGSALPAAGALSMRAPPGELSVAAELGDGRRVDTVLQMRPEGLALSEREFNRRLRIEVPGAEGHLEGSQIMPVVKAGTRQLQRCYEQALKNDASLRPRLRLRITVDPRGRVSRSKMLGEAPAGFARCVQGVAASFRFPSPGAGSVTFDAPLRFKQRQ